MDGLAAIVDWAWAHHAGEWAWYTRSVIVLALCYAAYKRSVLGVLAAALMLPLSLVLTPAPIEPRPAVLAMLERQRESILNASWGEAVVFLGVLTGYLWLLAFMFWRRLLLLGVFVLNLGAFVRVIYFFWRWPEESVSIVPSTLTTVIIADAAILSAMAYARTRGRDADSAA